MTLLSGIMPSSHCHHCDSCSWSSTLYLSTSILAECSAALLQSLRVNTTTLSPTAYLLSTTTQRLINGGNTNALVGTSSPCSPPVIDFIAKEGFLVAPRMKTPRWSGRDATSCSSRHSHNRVVTRIPQCIPITGLGRGPSVSSAQPMRIGCPSIWFAFLAEVSSLKSRSNHRAPSALSVRSPGGSTAMSSTWHRAQFPGVRYMILVFPSLVLSPRRPFRSLHAAWIVSSMPELPT